MRKGRETFSTSAACCVVSSSLPGNDLHQRMKRLSGLVGNGLGRNLGNRTHAEQAYSQVQQVQRRSSYAIPRFPCEVVPKAYAPRSHPRTSCWPEAPRPQVVGRTWAVREWRAMRLAKSERLAVPAVGPR